MHPVRRQRLLAVVLLVAGATVAVGLLAYALRQNLNLFYAPAQVVAGEAPAGARIRVGGLVVPGSVERGGEGLEVRFALTDGAASVPVVYRGILPDLFAEGEAAVAAGALAEDGTLVADQVLAKHDENYTPPEVAEALKRAQEMGEAGTP
ncbi:MAG: cytochrome c-type biogenesis protein CcmE [Porticoccaceae bacterium]|nr:MAG: cytochrome c-type biogenesis protein CcmE [Porticoccaceae bacterium]